MNRLGIIAVISFLIVGVGFIMNSGFGVGKSENGDFQRTTLNENISKKNGMTQEELREKLTPLQYKVTQENGTERPYSEGNYEANKEAGIYVDIVDGTPLYSSLHKYDSGTGWPSFWQGIDDNMLVYKEDNSLFTKRIEVRSKVADSHLGHIFPDGPADKGGQRHCINGASLKFIPVEDLESEGYGEYLETFKS